MWDELMAAVPVLTDGAWGTQMQARGLPIGASPEAWNVSKPDAVFAVAQAYVDAGSRVILTNTFGANSIALRRHGLQDRAAEIAFTGAALSRQAANGRAHVFASIGPTGLVLAMEEEPPEVIKASFVQQARNLADGGADALVIETMSELAEARLAVAAANETGLPVVVSMTYGAGRAGDRTPMGVTPEEAAAELEAAGADAIGANCGDGAEQLIAVTTRLRAATRLPLWIKPNAGLPVLENGRAVYRTSPDDFAAHCCRLVDAGAGFIGGCCGTAPAFIAALHDALAERGTASDDT
ncbi:MAG: homocysteine S-methyltransferase family protein [Armatimonadetes bacterium]|nr:homocysteine S-methyltransferase family protein [Armatimonadota bacterium]